MNWIIAILKKRVENQIRKVALEEESHRKYMVSLNEEVTLRKMRLLKTIKLIKKIENFLWTTGDNIFKEK